MQDDTVRSDSFETKGFMFHDLSLFTPLVLSTSHGNSHTLVPSYRQMYQTRQRYPQTSVQFDSSAGFSSLRAISTNNEQEEYRLATNASHDGSRTHTHPVPRELPISLGFSVIFFPGMKARRGVPLRVRVRTCFPREKESRDERRRG